MLNHRILKIITVLSNGTDAFPEEIPFGRIDAGVVDRFGAKMLAGKLSERAVPPRVHDDRLGTVIGDKFIVSVQRDGLISAFTPVRVVRC